MPELIHGLPVIAGNEDKVKAKPKNKAIYASISDVDFNNVGASFGIALHMHQPTIPASSWDIRNSRLIGNLQNMFEHQDIGDNHNASVFLWCYSRMADFIRELQGQGKHPRVMFDYSGNLLWGLGQMGQGGVLDNLKSVTCNKDYYKNVEWLGTMWSHAVVTSTPIPDIELHISAWRQHFASIFGYEALERIKGFSPPEMHLPIHPDVCYEYIKTLKSFGYEWLLVQEHTIEGADGKHLTYHHFPHKLVAKNSLGEKAEITVLIKTQGSDTKLVAQMQPYYEAKSRGRENYAGANIPPYVLQISDGENGGVMMNEFPPMYKQVFWEISSGGTVAMNGSEYLEFIQKTGVDLDKLPEVQPISQGKIWEFVKTYEPGAVDKAIEKAKEKYHLNLDKASWTNDRNWVKGYENVLDPMNKLSAEFHRVFSKKSINTKDPLYQNALMYLLLSQTSCFRYWGQGVWTEYAKEIIRRGMEILENIK